MDYSSSQKRFYIKTAQDSSTFDFDEGLPRLPVPTLETTLEKYLVSVKPFLSKKQYGQTACIVKEFQHSEEGQTLQNLLLKRAKVLKSWISGLFNIFSEHISF